MKLALCVLGLVVLAHARVERVYPRKSLARGSSSAREISHQHEPKVEHEPQVETHDIHEPQEVLSHNVESESKTEVERVYPRKSLARGPSSAREINHQHEPKVEHEPQVEIHDIHEPQEVLSHNVESESKTEVERVYPRKSLARGPSSAREINHQHEPKVEHEPQVETHDIHEPQEILSHNVESESQTEVVYPKKSLARGSSSAREINHQHEPKVEHEPQVEIHDIHEPQEVLSHNVESESKTEVERVYPRKSLARGPSSAREINHQHEPKVEHEPQVETHDIHEPQEILSHNVESESKTEVVYPKKSLARGSSSAREINHQHEPKVEHEPQVQTHDIHEPQEVLSHNVESESKTEAYHPKGPSAGRGHVREHQHRRSSDHSEVKAELEKSRQHSRMDAIREALERDDKEHVRRTRSHHGYGNQYGHRHSSESSCSSSSSESHEHGNHAQGRYFQQGYSYQQGYSGYKQGYNGNQQGYGGRQGYGR